MAIRRGKGEGSLYQRKSDGRWVGSFKPEDGSRKYVYGDTRKEAHEKLQKAMRDCQQGKLLANSKQTVRQYLEQWLEQAHHPSIRETTYHEHGILLRVHILPALGHVPLQRLTPQRIQAFYAKKLDEGLSTGYIQTMHAILHKALDNAVKWELVPRNVCDFVTAPRIVRHERQPLTPDQAQQLLQAAKDHRLEALLTVAITTGMRKGELLALRWVDINLNDGSLQVRRTVSYISGKGYIESEPKTQKGRRKIILPPVVLLALKQHQMHQKEARLKAGPGWEEHGLVFCNLYGRYLSAASLTRLFRAILKAAGVPRVRFHDLRHSAATILLSMGIHPKVVQELLGHSNISMTMNTYSHVLPAMQQEAMEKMNKLFGG